MALPEKSDKSQVTHLRNHDRQGHFDLKLSSSQNAAHYELHFDSPRGLRAGAKTGLPAIRPKLRPPPPVSNKRKQTDVSQLPVKRALSHSGRLELFTFLIDRGDGKTTSERELAEAFGMSVRLVEYHLLVLEDAELVSNIADELGVGSESCYVATARL